MCRRRRGTVCGRVTTTGNRGYDRDTWRRNRNLRTGAAEVRREDIVTADQLWNHTENVGAVCREFLELADRSNRHDARQHRRECERAAGVSGRNDARNPFLARLEQLLTQQLRELISHNADVDQVEVPLDAFIDSSQQIAHATSRNDLEHLQLGPGRATDDTLAGVRSVDDAGAMRPMR